MEAFHIGVSVRARGWVRLVVGLERFHRSGKASAFFRPHPVPELAADIGLEDEFLQIQAIAFQVRQESLHQQAGIGFREFRSKAQEGSSGGEFSYGILEAR